MSTRKPPALAGEKTNRNLPMPERAEAGSARPIGDRIPNGEWVTCKLYDVRYITFDSGREAVEYSFRVVSPRIYENVTLRETLHDALEKSLEKLAEFFPGVDFLDADRAWEALRGVPIRVHVGYREYVDRETGEVRTAYRIASFRPDERSRVG